jgi:PKD repeat protein
MVLTDDLLSYYKLDEISGTTAEDSHGDNDGTANNARVFTSEIAGKINTAGDFTQGNDWIDMGTIQNFRTDFTLTAWFYSGDLSAGSRNIVTKDTNAQRGWVLRTAGDKLSWEYNGGAAVVTGSTSLSTNTWYMATVTVSGNTHTIYLNAGSEGSNTKAASDDTNAPFQIGRRDYSGAEEYFNGRIDEVGIWSRALTTDEITELFNSGSGLVYPFVFPPVAAFSADVTSGDYPLSVAFTDESTETPTSWLWDFGDSETSVEQSPTHIYTSAGTYTVTLTATNDDGSDDEIKVDYITVTTPPTPPTPPVTTYTLKQAMLKTNYPIVEGLTAGTTKQTGRKMQLEAEQGSFVPQRERVGIDY